MVIHYSDTKLFNVSNYEKVYLREKKLQKISIRVKKEVPQRCCSIEDTIAEGPCDKAAEHTKATKSQRCCSIEDTVAITSQQTKQRRAPAKPMSDAIATQRTKHHSGETAEHWQSGETAGNRECQKKSGHEGEREGYDIFSTSEREMWRRAQPSMLRRMPK